MPIDPFANNQRSYFVQQFSKALTPDDHNFLKRIEKRDLFFCMPRSICVCIMMENGMRIGVKGMKCI